MIVANPQQYTQDCLKRTYPSYTEEQVSEATALVVACFKDGDTGNDSPEEFVLGVWGLACEDTDWACTGQPLNPDR